MNNTIFFVNFSNSWGGGEVQHFELAKEFKVRGVRTILVVDFSSVLHERANKSGIETLAYSTSKLSFLSQKLLQNIKKDILTYSPRAIILNGSTEIKHYVPIVPKNVIIIYRRGHPSPISPSFLNRKLFKKIDIFVTNSQFSLKSAFNRVLPYCKSYPVIIKNGIKIDFNASIANYTSKSVLFVGRLEKEKDVAILIEAMHLVLKKVTDAKLIIVGEGKERVSLEILAMSLGIQKSIMFVGFSNDVTEYYSKSSLLVLPSKWEAFGVVLLEAMNHKMPCITFSGHAADEIIDNNYNGILVKDRSSLALANAIISMITDEDALERMGNHGFRKLVDKYSIKRSVDDFEKLVYTLPEKS